MPIFNFPVPGRRQKKAPPPTIATPLTKAQKILGSNQLNIDSPTLPREPSKAWESALTSGRSIAISECSISYDDGDQVLQSLTEGEVVDGRGFGRGNMTYEEPKTIPRKFTSGNRGLPQVEVAESLVLGGAPHPSQTDASSLRRQQSSSTITSFYDKANVPLDISQQTSSSAMAKGPPPKASSLLDIGGTMSQTAPQRKKPSRLDLSLLLPGKSRSPTSASSWRGGFLSAESILRSPSSASTTTPAGSTPPPIKQRADKKLLKNSSKKNMRDTRPQSPLKETKTLPAMGDQDRLHELYDHYEQMSFRNMMKHEHRDSVGSIPPDIDVPATCLRTPTTHSPTATSPFSLSPRPAQGASRPTSGKFAAKNPLGAVDTASANALGLQISLSSPGTDCAASISSRHTRTSKASKQTNPSLVDLDLQQSSVLSLSSDSEDDFDSISKTSLFVPRSPSDAPSSPDSRRPAASPVDPVPSIKAPRPGYATRLSSSKYLDIPEQAPPPNRQLPTINPRTSSASLSSTATIKGTHFPVPASSSLSSSRMSRSTTPTTSLINESRPITMAPTTLSHSLPHNRSSDQPTPPLSPTSVDFFLRSHHNSMLDGDQGSIRSSQSLGAPASNRFMAVTRQEELLLAALRQKRARMRESIIAEFEEGHSTLQSDDAEGQNLMRRLGKEPGSQDPHTALRPATSGQFDGPAGFRRTSKASSGLVSFSDFPMAVQKVAGTGGAQHDNVVYLSRPLKSMTPSSGKHPNGADASSGMSDYLDFDDSGVGTGTGTATGSSDEGSMRPATERSTSAAGKKRVSRMDSDMTLKSNRVSRRSSRSDVMTARMASMSPAPLSKIRENGARESAVGVPRPDSPVEGLEQPPRQKMPRKKAVRISAVGMSGSEAGWWDDEG